MFNKSSKYLLDAYVSSIKVQISLSTWSSEKTIDLFDHVKALASYGMLSFKVWVWGYSGLRYAILLWALPTPQLWLLDRLTTYPIQLAIANHKGCHFIHSWSGLKCSLVGENPH